MQMQVRSMLAGDANAVCLLSNQLGYPLSAAQAGANLAYVLRSPEHCAFVAVREETVIGWVHAFVAHHIESAPFVEIGGLVVHEAFRGQGIGHSLVDRVKEWARTNEISVLRLRSNTKRTAAHRFYRHLQFSEIKEQKVFALDLRELS